MQVHNSLPSQKYLASHINRRSQRSRSSSVSFYFLNSSVSFSFSSGSLMGSPVRTWHHDGLAVGVEHWKDLTLLPTLKKTRPSTQGVANLPVLRTILNGALGNDTNG